MTELDLGVFKEFWNGHPNHLPLLTLYNDNNKTAEWNLAKSLDLLDSMCNSNNEEELLEGLFKLIIVGNYRTYLVAILASFKISNSAQQNLLSEFWTAASKDSKVTIQILSVLSIIDENFELEIQKILSSKKISKNLFKQHIKNYQLTEQNKSNWKRRLINLIKDGQFKIKHDTI